MDDLSFWLSFIEVADKGGNTCPILGAKHHGCKALTCTGTSFLAASAVLGQLSRSMVELIIDIIGDVTMARSVGGRNECGICDWAMLFSLGLDIKRMTRWTSCLIVPRSSVLSPRVCPVGYCANVSLCNRLYVFSPRGPELCYRNVGSRT